VVKNSHVPGTLLAPKIFGHSVGYINGLVDCFSLQQYLMLSKLWLKFKIAVPALKIAHIRKLASYWLAKNHALLCLNVRDADCVF
jgi:hypothetical protein